ncbi:putative Forkhead-associated (FHA) domain [Cocos nucifera]|uniref:Putative Forkhead-associated (FHA) domain n=1 Tax=Cocos nucifera TaxID=13894 RepID=A0A8K0MXN3_COCNU|nr:putative Forkhead-associated (FHA) domain [Cocos nucifera]
MEFHSSTKRRGEEEPRSPFPSSKKQRIPIPELGFFHLRSLSGGPDPLRELICLRSDRVYTAGRESRRCEIVFRHRCISRRHCQFFLDGSDRKLRLIDGFFLTDTSDLDEIRRRFRSAGEGLASRVSLNGVFINGRRLPKGIAVELTVGDEILLGCPNAADDYCRIKYGFVVERILLSEATGRFDPKDAFSSKGNVVSDDTTLCRSGFEELVPRAVFLLNQLRSILGCSDPVSYLRNFFNLDHHGKRSAEMVVEHGLKKIHALDTEKRSKLVATWRNAAAEVISSEESDRNVVGNYEHGECSTNPVGKSEHTHGQSHLKKDPGIGCYSDGKTFFLNRLELMGPGTSSQHAGVTLPELLHPVESLFRVFIGTFTCDVSCYPPFCDEIAFGKDRKKKGIACHHPKLIVLQREHSIRVVITSANLVPKQVRNLPDYICSAGWYPPLCMRAPRTAPDYSALFGTIEESKSDFAAQLAGFIASLITDVPSQAHWIKELTKYDFGGAVGHLIASAQQTVHSKSVAGNFLGCVQASVVGLSHRFHAATDSNCAQVKILASLLGKCRENTSGTIEVLLKRNMNIPADANAVSILVADLDQFSEGGSSSIGTSVNSQFLAAFSAAAGKRSYQYPDSEESDPESEKWILWYPAFQMLAFPVGEGTAGKGFNLDDITLPFVMPAPKYQDSDRPATAQAMREAVAVLQESSVAVAMEEVNEDIPDEEEEAFEASDYFIEEREEEKIYAEMLWSQVDSES